MVATSDPMSSVRAFLSERVAPHLQVWVGSQSPDPKFTTLDLAALAGFRPEPRQFSRYGAVILDEPTLAIQGWRILIDSAIRLLTPLGYFCTRHRDGIYINVINLKSFLFRRLDLKVQVELESLDDGVRTTIFRVERASPAFPLSDRWTFGVLTQGKRTAVLKRLSSGIRHLGGSHHQIIIAGPHDDALTEYDVEYTAGRYSDRYSDICVKKNDIVALARNENVCIVHDRYWLGESFFSGFEKFGYDFDYITVSQAHETGEPYPSFCAMDSRYNMLWGKIYDCLDDRQTWTGPYINGGLIIAKRWLLQSIPFNHLLFHAQAEDVELAERMIGSSIVPRINPYSLAITDAPTSASAMFIKTAQSDYHDVLFHSSAYGRLPGEMVDLDDRFMTLSGRQCRIFGRPGFQQRNAEPGILLYGPYIQLVPGDYEVTMLVEAKSVAAVSTVVEPPEFSDGLVIEIVHGVDARELETIRLSAEDTGRVLPVKIKFKLTVFIDHFQVRARTSGGIWAVSIPTISRVTALGDALDLDPRFLSIIGTSTSLVGRPAFRQTESAGGTLIYGPYTAIRRGSYKVSFAVAYSEADGHSEVSALGRYEVTINGGQTCLYDLDLLPDPNGHAKAICHDLQVDRDLEGVEFRVLIRSGSSWIVTLPEIVPV